MTTYEKDSGYGPLAALLAIILFIVTAVAGIMAFEEDREHERADAAEAHVEQLEGELEAARDSVLAGEIEGFGLRCYLVREE